MMCRQWRVRAAESCGQGPGTTFLQSLWKKERQIAITPSPDTNPAALHAQCLPRQKLIWSWQGHSKGSRMFYKYGISEGLSHLPTVPQEASGTDCRLHLWHCWLLEEGVSVRGRLEKVYVCVVVGTDVGCVGACAASWAYLCSHCSNEASCWSPWGL